jgi:hypothetical protein
MQITIPRAGRSDPVRVDVVTPRGGFGVVADGTQSTVDFVLPPGVAEDELHISLCFCGVDGKPFHGESAIVVREPKPAPKPVHKAKEPQPPAKTPTKPAEGGPVS